MRSGNRNKTYDSDDLGSDVREGSLDEDSEETEELAEAALDTLVLHEGTGVLPVGETLRSEETKRSN